MIAYVNKAQSQLSLTLSLIISRAGSFPFGPKCPQDRSKNIISLWVYYDLYETSFVRIVRSG